VLPGAVPRGQRGDESLEISAAEDERVRAEIRPFVVLPGDELAEIERVVKGNARYLFVEKVGQAAEIAHAGDAPS
jgi:hypothetical protein